MDTNERQKTSTFGFGRLSRTQSELLRRFANSERPSIKDLSRRETIFQIGVPPVRIDVITSIGRIKFEDAWAKRMKSKFGSQPVFVLSRKHLIANKEEIGRPQDIADAKWLRKNAP